ncbi:hypothetical protein KR009_003417, partial [Drosophila setifemur]
TMFLEHKAKILDLTGQHVDRLHELWMHMFEPNTCEEFLLRLEEHVNTFYHDLLSESRDKRQAIQEAISGLWSEADDLTRLLHKPMEVSERPPQVPLVLWQLKLDDCIERLREELAGRRAEIGELLQQQEQLCEELDELPLPLPTDPLPTPDQMDTFREHLEQLRRLRVLRLDEFKQLTRSIKRDMKLLECLPQSDAEERLLNQVDLLLTPQTLEQLRRMQKEFVDQVKELSKCIDDMREKIRVLWERLQETDDYAMRRVRDSTEYTQRTYDVLREELERCQQLQRQNLKTFIARLRLEIKEWWDLTLRGQEEREAFSSYYTKDSSEELLEKHELKLDELKDFYNENKKIFDLYNNRADLWTRMVALEAKANDPNRFNNRGGQLLKEEKERKAISTKLPKIEQQITELVQVYVNNVHSPFLVNGEDILEHMAEEWDLLRQPRQQAPAQGASSLKKDANNHKMMPPAGPLTPKAPKCKPGLNGSSSSLKKTPSKGMAPIGAKSTGNLQKRRHPNNNNNNLGEEPSRAATKRNLITSLECNNHPANGQIQGHVPPPKSPLKKVRVLDYCLRRGKENGRLSAGGRKRNRPIPQVRVQPPSSEDNASDDQENGPYAL